MAQAFNQGTVSVERLTAPASANIVQAVDAVTGDRLWQFNCGAGVNAPPMAYEIDGVQYVAVAAGGHGVFGYAPGNAVIAFALSVP